MEHWMYVVLWILGYFLGGIATIRFMLWHDETIEVDWYSSSGAIGTCIFLWWIIAPIFVVMLMAEKGWFNWMRPIRFVWRGIKSALKWAYFGNRKVI
jgi:hypothetical protein